MALIQIKDAPPALRLAAPNLSRRSRLGWFEFALALSIFLLSHAIPVRAPVKPWLVARVGARGFSVLYSLLSLAVLAWVVVAAGRAPHVALWDWAPWQNAVVLVAMFAACLIVALTLGRPNPFSFGGPDAGFDPDHPGLVRVMRHPLLLALGIWSAAHGLANGTVAHVVMFLGFAGFAALGTMIVDRRRQARMGGEWRRLWEATRGADAPVLRLRRDLPRLAMGTLAWGALIALHGPVIGVSPWP